VRSIRCDVQVEADRLYGQQLDESHYDTLVGGSEPCDVYKPDGTPLLKYRPGWFSEELCRSVLPTCRKVAQPTTNRGMASGTVREGQANAPSFTKSGRRTNTSHAKPVASGIAGYFDRNPRFPFCRQTAFLISEAAAWKRFLPYIARADEGFREFMPDRWEVQREHASRTASDWVIPQSTFTTVTVNKNFQTATHKDAGDLHSGFGVMSCLRNDKYDGAYLVFPAYRVAVNFAHGCLCLADVHEWHSNTGFKNMRAGYERITLVFYYREKMIHCKSAREEVEWAKNRKRGESMTG
jgi:hypothetical protein